MIQSTIQKLWYNVTIHIFNILFTIMTTPFVFVGDFNCIISDLDTKSGNMATSNNLKLILENIIDTNSHFQYFYSLL
jgi:hypothetical protein